MNLKKFFSLENIVTALAVAGLVAGTWGVLSIAEASLSRPIVSGKRQDKLRAIVGRVAVASGTPSVAQGTGFTVADTGAGQVTVTLSEKGSAIVGVQATAIEGTDATGHSVKADTITGGTSVLFGVYVADGTDGALVDDVGFSFTIWVKEF